MQPHADPQRDSRHPRSRGCASHWGNEAAVSCKISGAQRSRSSLQGAGRTPGTRALAWVVRVWGSSPALPRLAGSLSSPTLALKAASRWCCWSRLWGSPGSLLRGLLLGTHRFVALERPAWADRRRGSPPRGLHARQGGSASRPRRQQQETPCSHPEGFAPAAGRQVHVTPSFPPSTAG